MDRACRPAFNRGLHLGTPSVQTRRDVHDIWDRLGDFDAAQVDSALTFLLQSLCSLVGAQNANWIGAVRLPDALPNNPVRGWRPPVVHFLHSQDDLPVSMRPEASKLQLGVASEIMARMAPMFGRFRAGRLCDLAPASWFASDAYKTYCQDCGNGDALYVAFPVKEDAESYFGVFRARGQPRFTAHERNALAYALRGIKWFHRQLLLSHGLPIAETPLAPVERRVLQGLLTGKPEKEVAAELGHNYYTTHQYVTVIYRKFGVNNRAGLMALWLGSNSRRSPFGEAAPAAGNDSAAEPCRESAFG